MTGKDTVKYVEGAEADQIQSNGVDLKIDKLFKIVGSGKIFKSSVVLPDYMEISTNDRGIYSLDKGVYIFQIKEKINVPLDAVGFCLPRSSLVRSGAYIGAALWDSGYVGFSRILLKVDNPLLIERGARIAQFILIKSRKKVKTGYNGRYQKEQLKKDSGKP
jgi:deoxycytidine triphosphate deaminase